jgi:acetyl esterase/lipase
MKAPFESARDAFDRASPMSRVRADAPPFLIVHGDCDSLVPVEEARRFARMLRAVSESPVVYAEIPGAQHAFEIFPSLRSTFVIHGVERFLAAVYSAYLAAGGTAATPAAARRA